MLKNDKTKKREERHKITQEDFTPDSVVESLLNSMPLETYSNINKTILDNSCGIGNILVAVLKRKLTYCHNESDILSALKSIYGVELMADNVEECREHIYKTIINKLPEITSNPKLNNEIRNIIKNRIQWYDSLKFDYNHWPKLEKIKSNQIISFKEIQTLADIKYPMWYKAHIIQPTLFDEIGWD